MKDLSQSKLLTAQAQLRQYALGVNPYDLCLLAWADIGVALIQLPDEQSLDMLRNMRQICEDSIKKIEEEGSTPLQESLQKSLEAFSEALKPEVEDGPLPP